MINNNSYNVLKNIKYDFNEIKYRIFFIFFVLLIFRIGSYIPIPINELFNLTKKENNLNTILNIFSGGTINQLSIFTVGIIPYISASIIIQTINLIKPKLYKSKNEDFNNRSLNNYIKYLTLIISVIQSIGILTNLSNIYKINFIINKNFYFYLISILSLVTGTMILMWLGDQINTKGISNGISFIIFVGIISNIPKNIIYILNEFKYYRINILLTLLLLIMLTYFIIYIECSQYIIEINYINKYQNKYSYIKQNLNTYLPIKINISGIIPIIFSSSIMIFFTSFINLIKNLLEYNWFKYIFWFLKTNSIFYNIIFIFLTIFFSFFYTSLIFNCKKTTENLKKSGAFIIGIRPGKQTYIYINNIVNILTILGSIYITLVYLIPKFIKYITKINLDFNGISILIVVLVIIDLITQIQTLMISKKYKSIFKKYNK